MEKGSYGYGKKKLRMQLGKLAACSALVIGALAVGLILTHTRKNIWTVGAICSVLPAANFAVNVIARMKGLPVKPELYQKFAAAAEGKVTACDLIITAGQKLVPMQLAVLSETGILAYTTSKKLDVRQSERDMNGLLKSIGLFGKTQILTDFDAFLEKVRKCPLPQSEEERGELERKKEKLLPYSL